MTMAAPADPRSKPANRRDRARLELLLTAERLFATHGLDNVSLRQIASEAGYVNPATIQYHFGSKEALFTAIIDHRLPDIDRRRLELLDAAGGDLRGLVEAMARPFLELDESSHYAGFVARMVVNLDEVASACDAAASRLSGRRIRAVVDSMLPNTPPAIRRLRLNFATVLMTQSIAKRRARNTAGHHDRLSEEEFAHELFSAMAAVLGPEGCT